jgi:hypothetical protein
MFGKRAPVYVVARAVPAVPAWLAVDSVFNPVNVGIFLAALLFGMNA